MTHNVGDGPVQAEYSLKMTALAHVIDDLFNGSSDPKKVGFVLMVFPFGTGDGRCNYMSNAERADIVVLLREQLARFQGAPDVTGRA